MGRWGLDGDLLYGSPAKGRGATTMDLACHIALQGRGGGGEGDLLGPGALILTSPSETIYSPKVLGKGHCPMSTMSLLLFV